MNEVLVPTGRALALELRAPFERALERFSELRADAESRIVRWQYATFPIYDLDPLFFLDQQMQPGQLCERLPDIGRAPVSYGFSDDDRLIFAQRLTKIPENSYRCFYTYSRDSIVASEFHHSRSRKEVVNCSRLTFKNSVPVSL